MSGLDGDCGLKIGWLRAEVNF